MRIKLGIRRGTHINQVFDATLQQQIQKILLFPASVSYRIEGLLIQESKL